jgi:hypothetical protein
MSSPTDRIYDPGDPSPYAPRWVRHAPPSARPIPVRGPLGSEIDGPEGDEANGTLVRSEQAPPLAAAPPVGDDDRFTIDDIRVPRSLDPGIVPDPWAARGSRLRRSRLLGILGRLALAGSAAALVALVAVGKLSLPGATGATEHPENSPSFGTRFSGHGTKPQGPPIVAEGPSDPPAQVALVQPAAPLAAAPVKAVAIVPAAVPPPAVVNAVLPPTAEPPAPASALDPDSEEVAALIKRGQELAAAGDVAAARLTLRRAAEAHNAQAALALGATYDPNVLRTLGIFGVTPDAAMARGWYEKAKEYGSAEAPRRLELLATSER